MSEYEKLVLRALAQMLKALGNTLDEEGNYECERVARELERHSW